MRKNDFIKAVEKIYGKDKFDFSLIPEEFYRQAKLTFICKIHNEEFCQSPVSILKGKTNCSGCMNDYYQTKFENYLKVHKISFSEMKKRAANFAKKYTEKNPNHIYDFSETLYINNNFPIKIYCKKHKKYFWVQPNNMLFENSKCPWCTKEEKVYVSEKERQELENKFIEKAKSIYGDLYDYSKVHYIDCRTPVEIICKKHNKSFFKSPMNHADLKLGCPYCSREKSNAGFRISYDEFISQAKEKYGDKYSYNKDEFVNMRTKMTIYCKKHNYYFKQSPSLHLKSAAAPCPFCAKDACGHFTSKLTNEMFIERSKEIFGDDRFDYSRLNYINMDTPVELYCNVHKVWFKVIPEKHLCRQQGCPNCNNSESTLEREVRLLLERNNIRYEKEKKFEWLKYESYLRLDFYLPEFNIAIECHGELHFIQPKYSWTNTPEKLEFTQLKDKIKNEQCKEHNIQILYFTSSHISKNIFENYFLGSVINSKKKLLQKILEFKDNQNQK